MRQQRLTEFVGELPLVRSADEFQWRLKKGRAAIELAVQDAVKVVGPVLKSYHGVRLLLDAAKKGDTRTARALLLQKADVNATEKDGSTVLHWAAQANSTELVDALIKANKDFDLIIFPNRNHGFGNEPYMVRRRWDYFVKHLLGAEPPAGYELKPPATPFGPPQ